MKFRSFSIVLIVLVSYLHLTPCSAENTEELDFGRYYDLYNSRIKGIIERSSEECSQRGFYMDSGKISAELKTCLHPIFAKQEFGHTLTERIESVSKFFILRSKDFEKFNEDVESICRNVPMIYKCTQIPIRALIEQCSNNPNVGIKLIDLVDRVSVAACKDDGRHLADFITNDGLDCYQHMSSTMQQCIQASDIHNAIKDIKTATIEDVEKSEKIVIKCASKSLGVCHNKPATNGLHLILKQIESSWSEVKSGSERKTIQAEVSNSNSNHGSRLSWNFTAVLVAMISRLM